MASLDTRSWRQIFLAYSYLVGWIFLSGLVILFNNYLLHNGFRFPIMLTMFHMFFGSMFSLVAVRGFKVVPTLGLTVREYTRIILPIGLLFALSLWFFNEAYLYLSVPFIQMIKALMPVSTYCVSVLLRVKEFSIKTMLIMVVISAGVMVASKGQLHFVLIGFLYQIGGIAVEASRIVLIEILLQKRGYKLNPITTLYYIAPPSFVFLIVPFLKLELPKLLSGQQPIMVNLWLLPLNICCAIVLNLTVFMVIGTSSALVMNLGGVVKDWGLIGISALQGKPQTLTSLLGYIVAICGVMGYQYMKLREMQQASRAAAIDEGDAVLRKSKAQRPAAGQTVAGSRAADLWDAATETEAEQQGLLVPDAADDV